MYAYQFQFESIDGARLSLGHYRGQPILLVNTATESRYSEQARRLQALWENYKTCGLVVIGLPCDDFGHCEPHDNQQLVAIYRQRFGVQFPLAAKLSLSGRTMHPLFQAMCESLGREAAPRGNFTKYLFDDQGELVGRWPSSTEPDDPALTQQIERTLHAWVL